MALFTRFSKKTVQPDVLKKSYVPIDTLDPSRYGFLRHLDITGQGALSALASIVYYTEIAPVFSGVDRVVEGVASLEPILYDKKNDEYIYEHEVLDLLKYPNADSTYYEFMTSFASFFLITGNNYLIATNMPGNNLKEPVNVFVAYPQSVIIEENFTDGFTQSFNYSGTGKLLKFTRDEVNNRYRYYTLDKSAEIFQTKTFNPLLSKKLYGLSKLSPIYYEIEQYQESSKHNFSLLKRGARMSGVFQSEQVLEDDQYCKLQNAINAFYAGSENAGKIAVVDNGLSFKEMSQNNKDMDFLQLKKNVSAQISTQLKIPLPLVSEDTMTMANMEISKLMMYDDAVLPLANRIFQELSLFLLPRYKDTEGLVLTYQMDTIPALEPRRNAQLVRVNQLGVLTINEQRARMGYQPLDGGDDVLEPATLVPVASSPDADVKSKYISILKNQRKKDGSRAFTDQEASKLANDYFK